MHAPILTRADSSPVLPNEEMEIELPLLPVAALIRADHHLRLSLGRRRYGVPSNLDRRKTRILECVVRWREKLKADDTPKILDVSLNRATPAFCKAQVNGKIAQRPQINTITFLA